MMHWNYIVMGMSTLLLVFLVWKELKKQAKRRLIARLLASVLAVISLACVALPIHIKRKTALQEKQAILLTEGYDPDSLAIFLRASGKNQTIYTEQEFSYAHPSGIRTLHIFGYGLTKEALQDLGETSIVFHPSVPPAGIRAINWKQKILPGEPLRIQGNFEHSLRDSVKLMLNSFHTVLDSVTIGPGNAADFELQTIPKHHGRAVYELFAVSGHDTLEKESIPVEVMPADSLKVFILASFPDFENKFLAGRLAQKGHAVVMRTAISRNKYDYTYLNIPRLSIGKLSPALLDKFHLVIADALELQSLDAGEISVLQHEIMQKGMGLIIKADSTANKSLFYTNSFPLIYTKEHTQQAIKIRITGSLADEAVLSEQPAYITAQPGTQSLVQDDQSRILVGGSLYGSGRLICTTLGNTYRWLLTGKKQEYDALWSWCLQKAARKTTNQESWHIVPVLPLIGKPVQLYLEKSDTAIPEVRTEEAVIHFSQDPVLLSRWKGTYWPGQAGWQLSRDQKEKPYYWYVYADHDWKSLYAVQKIKQTREYIAGHPYKDNSAEQLKLADWPIPKIYFYLVFLLGCLYLWVERKL
jgi:hypothetical protein